MRIWNMLITALKKLPRKIVKKIAHKLYKFKYKIKEMYYVS